MIRLVRTKTLVAMREKQSATDKTLAETQGDLEHTTAKLASQVADSEEKAKVISGLARFVTCLIMLQNRSVKNLPKRQMDRAANFDLAISKDPHDGAVRLELVERESPGQTKLTEPGGKQVIHAES